MNKDTQNNWVEEYWKDLANSLMEGQWDRPDYEKWSMNQLSTLKKAIMEVNVETEQRAYQRALELIGEDNLPELEPADIHESGRLVGYKQAKDEIRQAITNEMNQHSKN